MPPPILVSLSAAYAGSTDAAGVMSSMMVSNESFRKAVLYCDLM